MKILKILYYAFLNTPNFFRSILGYDIKNNLIKNKSSKLNIEYWNIEEIILILYNFFLIKLPFHCPSWMPNIIKTIFFGTNSKYIKNDKELDKNNNCFIFINGVLGTEKLVNYSKLKLELLLDKPINVLFNASDTLIIDLIEALIGKNTEQLTEASTIALYTICSKLLDENINKLIIIAYSQGTIIIAKVLNSLHKLGLNKEKYLSKLEIYCFSNCASNMKYLNNNLPYMEHFANENDFVAKLGCNCPKKIQNLISIDGKIFINKNGTGHMLNSHYLNNFSYNYPLSKLNNYIKKIN